jgi:hypothetical protein
MRIGASTFSAYKSTCFVGEKAPNTQPLILGKKTALAAWPRGLPDDFFSNQKIQFG